MQAQDQASAAALRQAKDALFGDGFWGRERVNPAPAQEPVRKVAGRR